MGNAERTEKPTPRRLDKARKEGNFPSSRDMVGAAQFLVFGWLLLAYFADFLRTFATHAQALIQISFSTAELEREGLVSLFRNRLVSSIGGPLIAGAAIAAASLAIQLCVSRFGFSPRRLAPDLQRLNPWQRIQELPAQNLPQTVRSALLLPLFIGAATWLVWSHAPRFYSLPMMSWSSGVLIVGQAIRDLVEKALYVFVTLGLLDWVRQNRRLMKKLRMTKQEVRDEHKELEGNPQVKAKVRRLQREMSRRRMMAEVPRASAVIVNPTHYAVAIRYDLSSMAAPRIVAKGRNHLARRIREAAIAGEIPIVENPPLARALYAAAEVGQEIPPHLYKAVAEILAYLYRIFGGRLPGQAYA